MKKLLTLLLLLTAWPLASHGDTIRAFSTAGFFQLAGSGRTVESLNPAWRFAKDPDNKFAEAYKADFNDRTWDVVSLPNGLELLPTESSGGVNYRGGAWYRKHFILPETLAGKRLLIHFEGIMGKSKVWVNGELAAEHFGGFLPVAADVTSKLKAGEKNVIAVWCDNSNDPAYPPGKPQEMLDFCYFGGIYRDCWLIATDPNTYITDPNMADKVAGGGVVVTFPQISEQQAVIAIKTDLAGSGRVHYTLRDADGNIAAQGAKSSFTLKNPRLWSPENPHLYLLEVRVSDRRGKVVDGLVQRVGIRSISFNTRQGFVLNGKPYPRKLIGANRHQDFAVVGNALSNNLHWRDVQKLKECGMEVVRNAHYPQDPAFMDACDELGVFVIVNTPGWQFWNDKEPLFEQRVYSDIRQMVRRDRKHACVLMWEPVLNETWYPDYFAKKVHDIVREELPEAYTVSDNHAKGNEYFELAYNHPPRPTDKIDTTRVQFTREWGDNVDDWSSHNSSSRVAREWGEIPQLVQAFHYAAPEYSFTSIERIKNAPVVFVGATLWHSFDHQRGYHPDPFYGGLMDAFRRPKISYYMFRAQADHMEPMVWIANEMTPFSPEDVTVLSNCPQVRLYTKCGDTVRLQKRNGLWYKFKGAYNFMKHKSYARAEQHTKSFILAEGLDTAGNVVATHRRTPSLRPARLELLIDTLGASPVANGNDQVVVVAQMVDANGIVKRLNNGIVRFEIEGEGRLLGTSGLQTNPTPIKWGEAPVLVQTTTKPGKVTVRAVLLLQGDNTAIGGEISFDTQPAPQSMLYCAEELQALSPAEKLEAKDTADAAKQIRAAQIVQEELQNRLKEVERQQEAFGEKRK